MFFHFCSNSHPQFLPKNHIQRLHRMFNFAWEICVAINISWKSLLKPLEIAIFVLKITYFVYENVPVWTMPIAKVKNIVLHWKINFLIVFWKIITFDSVMHVSVCWVTFPSWNKGHFQLYYLWQLFKMLNLEMKTEILMEN